MHASTASTGRVGVKITPLRPPVLPNILAAAMAILFSQGASRRGNLAARSHKYNWYHSDPALAGQPLGRRNASNDIRVLTMSKRHVIPTDSTDVLSVL